MPASDPQLRRVDAERGSGRFGRKDSNMLQLRRCEALNGGPNQRHLLRRAAADGGQIARPTAAAAGCERQEGNGGGETPHIGSDGTGRGRLADCEAGQAFGLLVADLDALDARAARAVAHERGHPLDRLRLALEHRLYTPVPVVPDPAGDGVALGEAADAVAEEDALDVVVHDDSAAHASILAR